MGRPKIDLQTRLLTKIDVPGIPDVSPYIGIPITDWPPELTEPVWQWTGAVASARMIQRRLHHKLYLANCPEMPAFKVDGQRVIVHNLIYKLFVGIQPSLRYRASPPNYLDVNPAHWRARDSAPPRELVPVEQFDQVISELTELIHERIAVGRPIDTARLLVNGFTPEQIIAALLAVNPPTLHKYLTPDSTLI